VTRLAGPNQIHRVAAERTLWERLAGELLIIGAKRRATFIVQYEDGRQWPLSVDIPRCGIVDNSGRLYRIVAVPPHEKHRIIWVSGPSAMSTGRLAAYAPIYPEVARYLRRRRRRHFWLKLLGYA
jgi:hypothetical protein